ncbi:MAG: class I adenylate-forming enzyme family protein [Acidimicrobiales bacterium]
MDIDYLTGSPALLQNVFADYAALDPDRVWCTWQGKSFTYGEMDSSANRLARAMRDEFGIARGDVVAVYMANCAEYFIAMFAIHRLGAVYLPCSTLFSRDELSYQLSNADVRLVITDEANLELADQSLPNDRACPIVLCGSNTGSSVASLDELIVGRSLDRLDEVDAVTVDDLAMLIYTSGTTDRPKGVMLSQGNLTTVAQNLSKSFRWREDDRCLHFFPLYHSNGGLANVMPAILAGATLVMIPKFSASTFGQALVESDATYVAVNSTHINMIMRHPVTEFDKAHRARRMMLGMTIDREEWLAFEERFNTRLMPTFGLSETLGINIIGEPVGPRAVGSAGRVIRGYSLRLVDDDDQPVGVNEPGEVLLKTHQRHGLAMGYFKDPVKTAETFGEWMRTGDIMRADEEGYVWFVGRKKDMIKRSGFNVAGAEVERVIRSVAGVQDVAVVGTPDAMREEAIVAFVVTEENHSVQVDEIFDRCAEFLSDYKRPQFVEFIDALPMNFLGKIDRKLLREDALKYRIESTDWTPIDYRGN